MKMFLSFDFSVFPCDVNSVVNVVDQFSANEAQFKVHGRPLISSYLGKCLGNNGWQEVKQRTNGYLMPFIAEIEGQFNSWNSLDSWFCWGCAWPQGSANKTTADDQYYLQQLGPTIKYVTSVSPWMFAHYDYKNFYQRGDNWLISHRWEQIVEMRDNLHMVEMITWNDFGESDYFSSIKGLQPSGTTWADGYSHLPFFELSKYYISAYKTGKYPAITDDIIYFWARPHPAEATARGDPLARPTGFSFAEDYLWALVFAKQPGQVTLACGNSKQQFTVSPGVNKLKLPLSPGQITVSMARDGRVLINQTPSDFTYTSNPELYNYNVYVGSAKTGSSASSPGSAPPANTPYPTSTAHPITSVTATAAPGSTPTEAGELWSYYGCVEEGTTGSHRALTGPSYFRHDMTPGLCQSLCSGYTFAGVEYGQECYCGNSLTNNGASGDTTLPSKCSVPCAGSSSLTCGGAWTLSVFTTSSKPSAPLSNNGGNWRSLGCYVDSGSRFLKESIPSHGEMTTTMCTTHCASLGYNYAATEYGVECHCGNFVEKTSDGAGVSVDENECDIPCGGGLNLLVKLASSSLTQWRYVGNSSEKCGGTWRANVYSLSNTRNLMSRRQHLAKRRRRS
ncbi:hypothetical protein D9756_008033 [Leucocoprinus leucothites]|uniref:WSC domain-containing protein n=1 Tax=Leucocoprinus leucothites TaxID=201217 RepID=A0A8H5D4F0_9AGAR|nr:hypothetical protein D9756_008033 [Leucoagaricus leucothites]